jgi:hypothetical protein
MDIDKPEVIILAVIASSRGMVIILKPVQAYELRLLGETLRRGHSTARALSLALHRHQVATIAVAAAIFMGSEKPFGDQERFIARQLAKTIEVVPGNPAV